MARLDSILLRWGEEVEVLARRGADAQAATLRTCIEDLVEWTRARDLELLTLAEAAEESGLSYSAMQRAVREGRLSNVGTRGRPRVRRVDLPKKAARRTEASGVPDLISIVAAGRASPSGRGD